MDHRIQPYPLSQSFQARTISRKEEKNEDSFGSLFQQQIGKANSLKISKHAQQRLNERNIAIDSGQWMSIQERVALAKQKGITDSLVVTKNAALVVSTKNNTVVTAMNRKEANTHIFTNINGTILMD